MAPSGRAAVCDYQTWHGGNRRGDYKTDMRGFDDELTDAQIKAVLAYIKNSWPAEVQERHNAMSR